MNATIRAHNLIDLMQDLVSVLERENALLERPRSSDPAPLVEEKQALFKLYEDQIAAIAQEPNFAASLPDEINDRLKDLAYAFDDAMKVNRRKLEILTKSSQHSVDRIVEAAKSAAGQVPRYGRQGTVTEGRAAAPVAMNQEV